jgi:hypothetical protein
MIKIYKITNLPAGFVWVLNLVLLIKDGTWVESVPEQCVQVTGGWKKKCIKAIKAKRLRSGTCSMCEMNSYTVWLENIKEREYTSKSKVWAREY